MTELPRLEAECALRASQVAILPALLGSKEGYKQYREVMDGWQRMVRRALRGGPADPDQRADLQGVKGWFQGLFGRGVKLERGE